MCARAAALGLLFVIAFIAPALANARTTVNVTLNSFGQANYSEFQLRPGDEQRVAIRLKSSVVKKDPNNTYLVVEWLPDNNRSEARVALLASVGSKLPKLRVDGVRDAEEIGKLRDCSTKYPCYDADLWDKQSFYTRPGYALVRLRAQSRNVTNVLLHIVPRGNLREVVKGELIVQTRNTNQTEEENTSRDDTLGCGGRNGKSCGGKSGRCLVRDTVNNGAPFCLCQLDRGGRFCEDKVMAWRCTSNKKRESLRLDLEADVWKYLRYTNCGKESKLQLTARVDPSAEVAVYAKRLNQECNDKVRLEDAGILPSHFDENCNASSRRSGRELFIDSGHELSTSSKWFVGVVAKKKTRVELFIERCRERQCRDANSISGLPFLILPICLCILCVAAAVVCILLYVDRRHGLVTGPDKLSASELVRMCPEYALESVDDPGHSEHKTCAVCLCEFEAGERLRKLKCDHRFHSDCIDPWLTQNNASCPTCREEARVPELSERRLQRAIIKHVLAPILRLPLRARSRRISPMPQTWRHPGRELYDETATPTDESMNYCADEARDLPLVPPPVATDLDGEHPPDVIDPELLWRHVDETSDESPLDPMDEYGDAVIEVDEDVIAPQTTERSTSPTVLPDRARAGSTAESESQSRGVRQREESGLSTSSFYTAPLDFDTTPSASDLHIESARVQESEWREVENHEPPTGVGDVEDAGGRKR